MEHLVQEIEIAFENGAYLLALNSALTIPDICAALQSENGQTKKSKYCAWVDKYMPSNYKTLMTGEDIYKLRCAALHQGKLNHDDPRYQKIIFQLPEEHNNRFHNNTGKNFFIQIQLETFIRDLLSGYKRWEIDMKDNPFVEKNKEAMINYGIASVFGLQFRVIL